MDKIVYTTPKQQIQKLKEQGLIIDDVEFAEAVLLQSGYSNLIKSYREPFVFSSAGKKKFRTGISFEQVCSLYLLDKNLRNGIMASLLDLEEYIKESAADVVASSFGTHQDDYLQFRNYRNKRKKPRFSLPEILNKMRNTLDTDKNPIYHYSTVHGIVPPWILFKSLYFSTIVNFIDLLKIPEQNKLVQRFYDLRVLNISESQARMLMMDSLYTALEYRNVAAHGGRIYNYTPNVHLRIAEIFGSNDDREFLGFSQLLYLLSLFKYQDPFERLQGILNAELTRHCSVYPEDVAFLRKILDINIVQNGFAE